MDTTTIQAFFTAESLFSFQGATTATWLVPNVFGFLIGNSADTLRKWLALVTAFVIEYFIASQASGSGQIVWLIAFLNALLIFASAMGINQMTGGRGGAVGQGSFGGDRRFLTSWL